MSADGVHSPSSSPPLICFAVVQESRPFLRALRGNPSVRVLVTGMGRKNAREKFLQTVEKERPEWVITSGFAGGLNPSLPWGACVYAADANFPLHSRFERAGVVPVKFYCAERIACEVREKTVLRRETGADAVEMESGWIRAICLEKGIPSATVRIISDAADEDLPVDFNRFLTGACRLNFPKLALFLAFRPTHWKRLLRFQKQTSAAGRRLAELLLSLLHV